MFHGFVMVFADDVRAGEVVTRFAPSPTGYLHLGHAYAAWTAWRRARQAGGRFLLRIEDIDRERCRPDFAAAIETDLRWLGLDWDGPVLRQSGRLALYAGALRALGARGLVYPCFCSRADIAREVARSTAAPHGPDDAPLYPGTCRRLAPAQRAEKLAQGAPHVFRLDMAAALRDAPALHVTDEASGDVRADPAMFGDVVLGRRDVTASYHLCATFDDAAQGVTLVTRADDLRDAAHVHRLLQHLMCWPAPRYAHHALLHDGSGRRLSKRDGATSLRALREQGFRGGDAGALLEVCAKQGKISKQAVLF